MREIDVPLPLNPYRILVGQGLLSRFPSERLELPEGSRIVLVTDSAVGPLYSEVVTAALRDAGCCVTRVVVPEGEQSKSLAGLTQVYREFAAARINSSAIVCALGGGVVGDLAGFAAATYLRGLDVIQVPTTLLAQVDAAIGGKTGVDLPEGKNLVGAFHHPRLVVVDLDSLRTLPRRQYVSGLAEVIKYGVISDPGILDTLESHLDRVLACSVPDLEPLVVRCCEIKAEVVASDDREAGRRAILNFGHTVAHALEAATGYGRYLHGEAVAIGMTAALRLSVRLCGCDPAFSDRVERLLVRCGLPVSPDRPVDVERVLAHARLDKKALGGRLRFILAWEPGRVDLVEVDQETARAAIAAL